MATDTQHLRDSLIRSLQREPLLVEAEMALHSSTETDLTDEFRMAVAVSLQTAPPMARAHREGFRGSEGELIEQFRTAMQTAVSSGANLAVTETELLHSLDMEKLGEFRSQLDVHLEGDPEIAQEDLAIYVPAGFGITEKFRRGLTLRPTEAVEPEEVDGQEISAEPIVQEPPPLRPYAPGAFVEPGLRGQDEKLELGPQKRLSIHPYAPGAYLVRELRRDQEELPAEEAASAGFDAVPDDPSPARKEPATAEFETKPDEPKSARAAASLIAASLRAGLDGAEGRPSEGTEGILTGDSPVLRGLTAVPTLTAALEAIGPAGDDFGFLLRYGSYAPEGRRSEFLVGGLGLSALSKRLTTWLESHGSLEDQVQVIDEGSGELTIYLVGAEKQY